ncbi:MAG: transcription termination/antitermination protein NusG [Pseudomonadota bacterium]
MSTNDKQWYVIHVLSGSESKIAEAIESRIDQAGLSDQVASITVPSETVTEIRRGRRINTQRKFFPGYILVEMAMSDHAWQVIKNTPKVTGFLGTREEPTPISAQEAQRILNQVKEGIARPKPLISYEIGEQVKVCDGPFESFIGLVEDVDNERERVKVAVSIFGRATPVELEFSQVQKA